MSDAASLERRLRRIEDREAIRVLVGRYGLAMDDRAFDRAGALFAADARFVWFDGAFEVVGRDAIVAMYRERLAHAGPSFHVTHDQFVDFESAGDDAADDDRATGLVLAHAETSAGPAQGIAAIRYHDRYVREGSGWLFQERRLAFLYNVPVSDYDGILRRPDRIRLASGARPAHWP